MAHPLELDDELEDAPPTAFEATFFACGWTLLGVLSLLFAKEAFIAAWGALNADMTPTVTLTRDALPVRPISSEEST